VKSLVMLLGVLGAAGIVAASVSAASAPLPLQARVLHMSDLRLFPFTPRKQVTAHDGAAWSRDGGGTIAELRKDGFIAGIREDLRSLRTDSTGVSTVAQFKTAAGAAGAAAATKFPGGAGTFAVPGIPGARGFKFYRGGDQTRQFFIVFADGDFEYLVGFARPIDSGLPSSVALIGAVTSLYHRVAGRPAP
jgi:hypothetical protein